jgi:hypothetical protein
MEGARQQAAIAAGVLLKLSRAMPFESRNDCFLAFNLLLVRLASLLPSHNINGLCDLHRRLISDVLVEMTALARRALAQPSDYMTLRLLALLRELAVDTRAWRNEADPPLHYSYKAASYMVHVEGERSFCSAIGKSLQCLELSYEVAASGALQLSQVKADELVDRLSGHLYIVTQCCVAWVLPVLFDGMRLRRGLEIAAGLPRRGAAEVVNLADAEAVLGDGQAMADRERVGCATRFLLAAMRFGGEVYGDPAVTKEACTVADVICAKLTAFRDRFETSQSSPGKSMRILLDAVADEAEQAPFCETKMLLFQLAFAVPCLSSNLAEGDDGAGGTGDNGLLSVWDACAQTMRLYALLGRVVPLQTSLCVVLGSVVFAAMSRQRQTAAFFVGSNRVFSLMESLVRTWPPARLPNTRGLRTTPQPSTGRSVRLTERVSSAVDLGRFVVAPSRATRLMQNRHEACLSILCVNEMLRDAGGAGVSRPTEGVSSLKRIHLWSVQQEPWFCCADHQNPFSSGPETLFGQLSSQKAVDAAWRDIGSSYVTHPSLSGFALHGLCDTVAAWQQAADMALLPSEAMRRVQRGALDEAARVVDELRALRHRHDGPVFVERLCGFLDKIAGSVFRVSDLNSLWEPTTVHFCPKLVRKRSAEGAAAGGAAAELCG